MVRRMGEEARVRHILVIPEITSYDLQRSLKKLDSVRAELVSSKITFSEAVGKYSNDEMSKTTGGMVTNPETRNFMLEIDKLDPVMARAVAELKEGEYSQPQVFTPENSPSKSTRILFLRRKTDAHVLNLNDDYAIIQEKALQVKQMDYLNNYIKEKVPAYYIMLDPEYAHCELLNVFAQTAAKN